MIQKKNEKLEIINPNAAGIDIGSQENWVSVPKDRDEQSVKKFGAFTEDLDKIVVWLKECKVTTVALESTGVLWMPIYKKLEDNNLQPWLVNARELKSIPGRNKKTDPYDCQWLRKLHTYGLLKKSFIPEEDICHIRTIMRYKSNLIKSRTKSINTLQKALDQANIKIHNVLSDIQGESGIRIIKAIIAGERDPEKLASLADSRVKASCDIIKKSLVGNFSEDIIFLLKESLEFYEFINSKIDVCNQKAEKMLKALSTELYK